MSPGRHRSRPWFDLLSSVLAAAFAPAYREHLAQTAEQLIGITEPALAATDDELDAATHVLVGRRSGGDELNHEGQPRRDGIREATALLFAHARSSSRAKRVESKKNR